MNTRSLREHTSMEGQEGWERRNPSEIEGVNPTMHHELLRLWSVLPRGARQFRDCGDTHERRQVEMSCRGEMRPETVGAFDPDGRRGFAYNHGHDEPARLVFSDVGLVAGVRDCGPGPVEPRAQGSLSAGPLAQGRRGPGPVTLIRKSACGYKRTISGMAAILRKGDR